MLYKFDFWLSGPCVWLGYLFLSVCQPVCSPYQSVPVYPSVCSSTSPSLSVFAICLLICQFISVLPVYLRVRLSLRLFLSVCSLAFFVSIRLTGSSRWFRLIERHHHTTGFIKLIHESGPHWGSVTLSIIQMSWWWSLLYILITVTACFWYRLALLSLSIHPFFFLFEISSIFQLNFNRN